MQSFAFNFDLESNPASSKTSKSFGTNTNLNPQLFRSEVELEGRSLKEITCPVINTDEYVFNILNIENFQLKFIDDDLLSIASNDKYGSYDIISGEYEGGFKVWEGAIDLAKIFLMERQSLSLKRVIELGCGLGIPALVAMHFGCDTLYFSDFNKEVLEITWLNILLNKRIGLSEQVRCFAGDWISLSSFLLESTDERIPAQFSLILSAETLYSIEACQKICYMIENHLEVEGVALIASKKYYFGVGGGIELLEELIAKSESRFNFQIIYTFEDKISNIRQVAKITKIC